MELAVKKHSSPSSAFYHLGDFGENLFIHPHLLSENMWDSCLFQKVAGKITNDVVSSSGRLWLLLPSSLYHFYWSNNTFLSFYLGGGSTSPLLHSACEHVTLSNQSEHYLVQSALISAGLSNHPNLVHGWPSSIGSIIRNLMIHRKFEKKKFFPTESLSR